MPQEKKEFALSDFTPYDLKEGEEYMMKRNRITSAILWQLASGTDGRSGPHKEHVQTELDIPLTRMTVPARKKSSTRLRTRDRVGKLLKKIQKTIDLIDKDYAIVLPVALRSVFVALKHARLLTCASTARPLQRSRKSNSAYKLRRFSSVTGGQQ